jgi:hypothetical protein
VNGALSQAVDRIRLFLLAVMCWLCIVPTAHAIRPPSPAELQLKEETPCQEQPAYCLETVLEAEMRNGLFVRDNPLRYVDPTGHWGEEVANWWSGVVNTGAGYISAGSSHWIWNGTVGTVGSLVGGVAEPLRLGSSVGAVSGDPHATLGDVALAGVQEASRAAAVVPVGAAIGKGVGTLLSAGAKEAAGELAGAAGQAAGKAAKLADPGQLRLPPTRSEGADPFKLSKQIGQYGKSTEGMPPIEVTKGANGEMMINDGVTRATRAAMTPGTKVPVQVIEHNPNMNLQNLPKVGEKLPGQQ